jgi:peroxiredoxin
LAEYQRDEAAIRATGTSIAAVSVDSPQRSEGLRSELGLSFPILCDTSRSVVQAWELYNPREMGGIAIPAVFVIGPDLRVRYRSIDRTRERVHTDGVLRFLRGDAQRQSIERAPIRAGIREFARAFANAIRRGLRTPHR